MIGKKCSSNNCAQGQLTDRNGYCIADNLSVDPEISGQDAISGHT